MPLNVCSLTPRREKHSLEMAAQGGRVLHPTFAENSVVLAPIEKVNVLQGFIPPEEFTNEER